MKRLLVFALLSGLVLPLSFSACDNEECGPFNSRFVTTGFTSGAFKFEIDSSHTDSLRLLPPELLPIGEDTLLYSDFSMRLAAETVSYASSREHRASFSFISPAYACSPAPPYSKEIIEDIQIYSNKDFNDEYAGGENLAALFDVIVPVRLNTETYRRFDLNDFLATNPNPTGEIILLLKEPPQAVSDFQFTVEYSQESERLEHYEFQTNTVTLRPD